MAQRKSVHVVLSKTGNWDVVREGNVRPTRTVTTQRDAIVVGREYAVRDHTTLYIHNEDGDVRRQYSYAPRKTTRRQ